MKTQTEIWKYALLNSLWTVLYIILIGVFFFNAESLFGSGRNMLIPVAMLTLFVFSAALTGSLVLGRPLLWYLDGMKKEAVILFAYTLAVLFIMTIILLTVLHLLA